MNGILLSLVSLAVVAHALPQQSTATASASIDPDNPNQADPTAVPSEAFTLPSPRTPEPFPNGIPVLPDACNSSQLTEDCFNVLADDGKGAYLYFDKDHGCSLKQQDKIKSAFWGAQDLLHYAARWSTRGYSQDIVSADYWIGLDWRAYSDRITGNLGRASSFINDSGNKSSYITISCQDPKGYCSQGPVERKAVGGYAWNVDWTFWTYGHINMCDPFYTLSDISEKLDDIEWWRKTQQVDKLMNMKYYETDGQFLAHEMMHLRSTYNPEPKIVDTYLKGHDGSSPDDVRAYGPKRVHQLAHGDATGQKLGSGAAFSTINADSYAMLINTIFWWDVTQYFPGVPGKREGQPPPGIDPPVQIVFPSISLGDSTDVSIESIDDQFQAIIASYLVSDDAGDPPAQDQNDCHGVGGDYWVMSRDVAVQNVNDFCSQTEQTKDYNTGSVNALTLSVRMIEGGGGSPQDAPSCVGRFTNAVIDGCDGNDPVNNPHNYKFGSTLTTADGWEYKMTPLSEQVDEDSCDVSYRVVYDIFEIRGKNLPDGLFGANGEGLHNQLSGCGAVTDWKFERTPDDCCFQWYASGHLDIGTRACVGRALETAGGSSDGNCHGAGKRSADNIDRWSGYGDDSKHVFRPPATARTHNITM